MYSDVHINVHKCISGLAPTGAELFVVFQCLLFPIFNVRISLPTHLRIWPEQNAAENDKAIFSI
jgi:hypothetical protein